MNRRKIMLISALTLVIFVGSGYFIILNDGANRSDLTSPYDPSNRVTFEGNISWDGSFHMEGYIARGGLSRNVTEFSNMSLKIYSQEGEFMESWCLGSVNGTHDRFSISYPERPSYVIYVSPDYWHPDRVEQFRTIYYEWEDGQYVAYQWSGEPTELPVNPIGHDPCA